MAPQPEQEILIAHRAQELIDMKETAISSPLRIPLETLRPAPVELVCFAVVIVDGLGDSAHNDVLAP